MTELGTRPLGDLEKLFWATSLESNINWVQAIRVSGQINASDLRQALDIVQARHPLLSASVQLDGNKVAHFRRATDCPVPLRIVDRQDDEAWIREAETEINNPIDPSRPPLLRAILVQDSHCSEILLCGTHCNIDGSSILVIIRDLMNALAKLPTPPNLPMQLPFEQLFEPLQSAVMPPELAGAPPPTESPETGKVSRDGSVPTASPFKLAVWQLERDQTSRLIESCRKRGATVHSAICSAFLLSYAKILGKPGHPFVRCAMPINLRSACPPVEDDVGVYISMVVSLHPIDPTLDFWEVARSVSQQLNQSRQPEYLVAVHTALRETIKHLTAKEIVDWSREAVSYEFGVTNLGKLTMPSTFGPLKLEHFWPPVAVSNPLADTVAVFTFDGRLAGTITSISDRREFGAVAIEWLTGLN